MKRGLKIVVFVILLLMTLREVAMVATGPSGSDRRAEARRRANMILTVVFAGLTGVVGFRIFKPRRD